MKGRQVNRRRTIDMQIIKMESKQMIGSEEHKDGSSNFHFPPFIIQSAKHEDTPLKKCK
jgi:hypothetical protein